MAQTSGQVFIIAGKVNNRNIDAVLPSSRVSRLTREPYREGDLLTVGIAQSRASGPDAVVVGAATRRVGAFSAATCRLFADRRDLLHAVCAAGSWSAHSRGEAKRGASLRVSSV